MSTVNVQPRSLQAVREKRNDYLRALANSSARDESVLALPSAYSQRHLRNNEDLMICILMLTWVLGEDHLPDKLWNTDTRLPVGTWRSFEEPGDPVNLREIPE